MLRSFKCSLGKFGTEMLQETWNDSLDFRLLPLSIQGSHKAQIFNCICSCDSSWTTRGSVKIGSVHRNWGHCLWASGEQTMLSYSTAYAVWFKSVWKRFGRTQSVHETSGHCLSASSEQTLLSYQLCMQFWANSIW